MKTGVRKSVPGSGLSTWETELPRAERGDCEETGQGSGAQFAQLSLGA